MRKVTSQRAIIISASMPITAITITVNLKVNKEMKNNAK